MDVDTGGASAPADTGSVATSEPVIAATPNPISVEPRTATPGQVEESTRQAAEAKAATEARQRGDDPKKPATEPVVAEKTKPLSTREALRKAAEKVNAEPASDAKAVTEKAPPIKDAGPARTEDGKFAPKDPIAAAAAEEATATDATKPPPSRFSPDAKEKWAETPEPVRAEVQRAVTELTKGFEKHRAAAERDSSIAEFHDLAAKGNTTVKEALGKYVGMENQIRADPIKGLEIICQNAGLSLRDVAAHVLGRTPEQNASQADATIREMRAEIAELKKGLGGVTQTFEQQRTQTTHESVAKFAADPAHSRFEELSEEIAFFLQHKTKDLAEAYSLAERIKPAPAEKVTAELPVASSAPAAVAETPKPTLVPDLSVQTARGQKSIAGSPTAGSDPVRRQPSSSIKEAIRKAAAAAR